METQVKEQTTKNVNLQKVEDYLKSVSEHLYLTENGRFFKVFPVSIKDKLYCVTLEFDGKESNYAYISSVDFYVSNCGNNAKNVLSKSLFPQHSNKKTSIVNFKVMREKVEEIKKFIEEKFDGTNRDVVEAQVKKMLVGLTIKKEEGI